STSCLNLYSCAADLAEMCVYVCTRLRRRVHSGKFNFAGQTHYAAFPGIGAKKNSSATFCPRSATIPSRRKPDASCDSARLAHPTAFRAKSKLFVSSIFYSVFVAETSRTPEKRPCRFYANFQIFLFHVMILIRIYVIAAIASFNDGRRDAWR
ncbi:hypothetical protein, partial [Candidatus Burkholderia verschuerenii]|uniref:hypothetical protein n=1 Tax=Candidatus Burkholderia verschuerenii TaxID=242163 RepID=UPI001E59D620